MIAYFNDVLSAGKLSHAYIIEGEGEGKGEFIRRLAARLAPHFEDKIISSGAVDIHEFSPQEKKKSIGVDVVRQIKDITMLRPTELDFTFVIIHNADAMTTAAQNAALKILEEPQAGTYFFLLCNSATALLPTVRSRAVTLRAEGSTELTISDPEKVREMLKLISPRKSSELLVFLLKLPRDREGIDAILRDFVIAARDVIAATNGGNLHFFPTPSEAIAAGAGAEVPRLIYACECANATRVALGKNINVQGAKLNLHIKLLK
ncbi:MAG: hypothetical protein FWB93_03115 [Oscillospiraceae bacterium]|nr:hypothetical protein [Oscillospiraceae bacterium]